MHAVKIKIGGGLTILRCRRKHHLCVKGIVANLMRLVWKSLCERQDEKQAKHRHGINTPYQQERNHSIVELFSRMQVCRPHEAVMSRRVMFCLIVIQIGYAWLPLDE